MSAILTQSASVDEFLEQEQPVFEFSDVEMEPEEPRARTRSQSRTKEASVPPSEPLPAKTKKAAKEPKARRRIRVIREDDDVD